MCSVLARFAWCDAVSGLGEVGPATAGAPTRLGADFPEGIYSDGRAATTTWSGWVGVVELAVTIVAW